MTNSYNGIVKYDDKSDDVGGLNKELILILTF